MMTTLTMKEDDEKCTAGSPVATPLGPPSTDAQTQISASTEAPLPENTVAPILDNSIHDLSIPDVTHEPVIHPGGGDAVEHLDVHKVKLQRITLVSTDLTFSIFRWRCWVPLVLCR